MRINSLRKRAVSPTDIPDEAAKWNVLQSSHSHAFAMEFSEKWSQLKVMRSMLALPNTA